MPRKRRQAKTRIDTPLTDALKFHLMAGAWAPCRLDGWVLHAQGGDDDANLREAWAQHGGALTAEAKAAGFTPWGAARKRPNSAAFRGWTLQFLKEHGPRT